MDLRQLKPMFRWPLSPRRPRCPSSISSSSSSSALTSRAPSFSSEAEAIFDTVEHWIQECSCPEGSACNCPPARHTESCLSVPTLKQFTLEDLKSATRHFPLDRLIGEGAFGCVYKGWIDDKTFTASKPGSGLAVAVKKHNSNSHVGYREWLTEQNYLGQFNHPNLVKLIGFCSVAEHLLLVYEYMSRGSLDNHLFRRNQAGQVLSWAIRINVAIGVAEGLSFLHDADSPVVHRDVKSSHILLNSEFNAKLSGFGLARTGSTGVNTHVSTRVMGTYGFAAPEYLATGCLSVKADVYSFGVVLLELLSGRRAIDKSRTISERILVVWAKPFLGDKRKLHRIMDSKMERQYPSKAVHSVALIALRCLSNDPKLRPSMSEVLASLKQIQDVKEE